MKVVFDTSVLVPAMVEVHLMHSRAWPWLDRAKSREFEFIVAAPTLAELYAVLTTLPVRPRILPAAALKLIADNVQAVAQILPLQPSDYAAILQLMAEQGISGRAVYDAVVARVAELSVADLLLTFNIRDFERVWPTGHGRIQAP